MPNKRELLYYNEACATCGLPADLHLELNDPILDSPETNWGDRNRCRAFIRCNPPQPVYGIAWWKEN